MSNNLKSLLRTEINAAKANENKVWDIERQRVCAANENPETLVICCAVKDGLLYESFYLREGNSMVLKGITVYDKERTQMMTLRLEDKIRFSVREFELESAYVTTPRRYADNDQKDISVAYLGNKRTFKEECEDKRAETNKEKRKAKAEEVFHSLQPLTEGMKAWAKEDVLGKHHALLYDAKTREGKCERCGKTMVLPKSHTRHGQIGVCPVCGREVTYRSKGMLAYKYTHEAEVTFMQKLDNGNVVVRYYTAWLNAKQDKDSELELTETSREVIDFANSEVVLYKEANDVWHKVNRSKYTTGYYTSWFGKSWYETWGNSGCTYQGNLKDILDTSPLKYSCVEKYIDFEDEYITSTFTDYVRTWLKNPALEWMVKSGFEQIAKEVLSGSSCLRTFPMKRGGKNLAEVFRLNRQQWKAVLPYAKDISYKTIVMYVAHPEQKIESILGFVNAFNNASTSDLNTVLEFTTIHKTIKYCKENDFRLWMDYIRMSKEDGVFDKNNSMIVFPRYLKERHDEQIETRRAKELDAKKTKYRSLLDSVTEMAAKVKNLFAFHQGNLLMTVPETGDEIVDEGNTQHICVGSFSMPYMKNMASGLGFILFVRDENEPSKPFYTVEVKDGAIAQVRGKFNCAPTDEVKSFIKAFAQAKQLVCRY